VYADLDVLVSCSDNEGTPFSAIEGMAAGCAIVATSVGGVPDVIEDAVTGLLVPPGEPGAFASAVVRLLRDRALAHGVSAAARERARIRFSAARFASEMEALYRRLLEERRRASRRRRSPRR
jgi:glycosyltransferase involved in cell wall biosynthesis